MKKLNRIFILKTLSEVSEVVIPMSDEDDDGWLTRV